MALPTSMQLQLLGRYTAAGVTVEAYPSTLRSLTIELQSATANTTASSRWNSVFLPPSSAGPLRYTFPLPETTKGIFIRGRHPAQAGFTNGPFTPVVNAKPKIVPIVQRPVVPQVTFRGNVEIPSGSDVFASSSKTIKVGTQVTTGTLTKTLRIHAMEFVPRQDLSQWEFGNADARPRTAAVTLSLNAPIVLPKGILITTFKTRFFRGTTADTASFGLAGVNDTGGSTALATCTHDATSWQTKTVSAINHTVGDEGYLVSGTLTGVLTPNNARVLWVEVGYTVPSYDKTY